MGQLAGEAGGITGKEAVLHLGNKGRGKDQCDNQRKASLRRDAGM